MIKIKKILALQRLGDAKYGNIVNLYKVRPLQSKQFSDTQSKTESGYCCLHSLSVSRLQKT